MYTACGKEREEIKIKLSNASRNAKDMKGKLMAHPLTIVKNSVRRQRTHRHKRSELEEKLETLEVILTVYHV